MKKLIVLLVLCVFFSSCAYNSANLMAFIGKDMTFSYGLISIKHVDRVVLLRETNSGEGESKYNIPDVSKCIPYAPVDLRPTETPDLIQPIPFEVEPKDKPIDLDTIQ